MGAAQQPPRTIEQKGLESRGTSALAQAIGTGAPVPVDAAQQPAPPATVEGEWHYHDECSGSYPYTVGKIKPVYRCDAEQDAKWLRDTLNTATTLAAENKRLREALRSVLPDDAKRAKPDSIFGRAYAALAKAGGH
jgi:hypothetical protein